MAVLSAQDLDRFVPPARREDAAPATYLIAPLTWRQRAQWRAELARSGVTRYPSDLEVVKAVRAAVEEVAPENLDECLAAVDTAIAIMEEVPPAPPAEGDEAAKAAAEADAARRRAAAEAYSAVEQAMRSHPRVGSLIADRTMFNTMAPVLAAAFALRGWENVEVPFLRKNGVVPDDVLDRMDEDDLRAAGYRALELMRVSETARKN